MCSLCSTSKSFTSKEQTEWATKPCLQAGKYAKPAIRKHPQSDAHLKAASKPRAAPDVAQPQREAFTQDIILRLFTVAYLVVHDTPTSHFDDQLGLCRTTGGFSKDSDATFASGNASWTSRYIAAEMRTCLCIAVCFDLMLKWQAAKVLTLMADEVTDRAGGSILVQGLRYSDVGNHNKAQTDFIGGQELPRGDAGTVTAACIYTCTNLNLALMLFAFFLSDGAKVFAGVNTGVHVRFNEAGAKRCKGMWCGPHKFTVWLIASIKQFAYLHDVWLKAVEWTGRTFRFSHKKNNVYKEQQLLVNDDVAPKKFVESAFTRWLSHDAVTKCMHQTFIALLNTFLALSTGQLIPDTDSSELLPGFGLGAKKDISAAWLLKIMATAEFIYYMMMMRDLPPICALVQVFMQYKDADFDMLTDTLPAMCDRIEAMIDNPGENQARWKEMQKLVVAAGHRGAGKPSKPARTEAWMEKHRRMCLTLLVSNMRENMTTVPELAALQRMLQLSKMQDLIQESADLQPDVADAYFDPLIEELEKAYGGADSWFEMGKLKEAWKNWRASVIKMLKKASAAYILAENVKRREEASRQTRRARLRDNSAKEIRAKECTAMPFKVGCAYLLHNGVADMSDVLGLLCEIGICAAVGAVECERYGSKMKRKMRDLQHNRSVRVVNEEIFLSSNGPKWTNTDDWMRYSRMAAVIWVNMKERRGDLLSKTNFDKVGTL